MDVSEFKVGDLVKLQSGGALMTVWGIRSDGILDCIWHDKNHAPQRDAYGPLELFKISVRSSNERIPA